MRAMRKKWRSQAGESIGEVLIALLISVVGVVMLVGMINASVRVVNRSTTAMHTQYELTGGQSSGTEQVHLQWDGSEQGTITVDKYAKGGQVVFYAPHTDATAGG